VPGCWKFGQVELIPGYGIFEQVNAILDVTNLSRLMKESFLRSLPKMALGSASVLLALYFGLSPRVAKGLYTNMLFHPYPFPEGDYESKAIAGVAYEDLFFQSGDGTMLHAWYFEQPQSRYTILMSHGNTGNLSGRPALLEAILRTGASLLVYDYRGFGRSRGTPSVQGVIDDACAAHDFLVEEKNCSPMRIVLYGESIGAAISCQLSLRRPVRGMILQSAFASITKISKHHMPIMRIYPEALYPQPLLDSLGVLCRPNHPPVLIVHGHKDPVVPFSHGRELFEMAAPRKFFAEFPDAEHSDIPTVAPDRFVQVMSDFLSQLG
jgi:uncharacterized protein